MREVPAPGGAQLLLQPPPLIWQQLGAPQPIIGSALPLPPEVVAKEDSCRLT